MVPWAIYFKGPRGVLLRGFHLHPIAFLKSDNLSFSGTSLDEDLPEQFSKGETHVVTSLDELSLAELSPEDRLFKLLNHPMTPKSVFQWANHHTRQRHHWLFSHRILIAGELGDNLDIDPCEVILEKLRWARTEIKGSAPDHFTARAFSLS